MPRKKQFTVRVDEVLHKKLEDYRWENRISLNEAVSEALNAYLEQKAKDGDVPS